MTGIDGEKSHLKYEIYIAAIMLPVPSAKAEQTVPNNTTDHHRNSTVFDSGLQMVHVKLLTEPSESDMSNGVRELNKE